MLIKLRTLESIKDGSISTVFRVWKRPTVKTGGFLTTRLGVLAIDSIEKVKESEVTKKDLKEAGLSSPEALSETVRHRPGDLYRIKLHYHGPDPRIALRENTDPGQLILVIAKLTKMGEWTTEYLEMIENNPATRAEDLAETVGLPKVKFKYNVRKLKKLGLTISLSPGYELSPRGIKVLELLRSS